MVKTNIGETRANSTERQRMAVVTGSSSGIGRAITFDLAKRGWNIVTVGRSQAALDATITEIKTLHGVATKAISLDLTASDAAQRLNSDTRDLSVSILVSNAGDDAMGAPLTVEFDRLEHALNLNTKFHLALAHTFGRRFLDAGQGHILLVSSTAGLEGTPFVRNHAGSKAYFST